jgi:hypothetical protein
MLLTETPDALVPAIVVATGAVVVQVVASLASLLQARRNGDKLVEIHLQLNSRLDQLLAVTKKDAHAEGKLEGKEESPNPTQSP